MNNKKWLDNKCAFLLEYFYNHSKIFMICTISFISSNRYKIIFRLNTNHYKKLIYFVFN